MSAYLQVSLVAEPAKEGPHSLLVHIVAYAFLQSGNCRGKFEFEQPLAP